MEFEIYLPCRPDIVCDGILLIFTTGFVVLIVMLVWFVYQEYKEINKKSAKKRKSSIKK